MDNLAINLNKVNPQSQNIYNSCITQTYTKDTYVKKSSLSADKGETPYLEYNAQTRGDSGGLLGISTKSCKQDVAEKQSWKQKRQKKQDIARSLIGGRLEQCGRVPVPVNHGDGLIRIPDELREIKILHNDENFTFGGLMRCGSVWSCPDCASIISEIRRSELKNAFESAKTQNLSISMLTLTVPHYAKDSLKSVLDGIQNAHRTMKNRKAYKDIIKDVGLVGNIRALEVTHGKNGWHPHFHLLWFTEKNIENRIEELKNEILPHWQDACLSVGLPLPNEHGVDLVDGSWADKYISKWGISEEMTKGHLKQGVKEGHVSPFGLLDLYDEGDQNAGKKFKEYVKVFKGRRQLVWSKGLRDILKMPEQISDQEIIEQEEKKAKVFMTISYGDFKTIIKHNKQIECLSICSQGTEAVRAWISKLSEQDLSFP